MVGGPTSYTQPWTDSNRSRPSCCRPDRFEADRQRDVQLQLDGYAVLRFTNARVIHDVGAVVQQIGAYLRNRRRGIPEGPLHGRR
ncbi:DUF559 domain-containing protein [Micromonospora craniellae]|nr:DUF559 domain-containing protein [Micromonospora craniellae]